MQQRQLGRLLFLTGAFIGFALSIILWFTENRQEGIFVGIWVPSILALGSFWFLTLDEG